MIHHGTFPILAALCILATGCGFTDTVPKQQTATTDATETATAVATTIPTENTTAITKTVIIKTKAATEMKPDTTTAETAAAPAETNIYAKTAGTWYIDGDTDAAYWVMDGSGSIAAYYASDQLEYSGYLQCADDGIILAGECQLLGSQRNFKCTRHPCQSNIVAVSAVTQQAILSAANQLCCNKLVETRCYNGDLQSFAVIHAF